MVAFAVFIDSFFLILKPKNKNKHFQQKMKHFYPLLITCFGINSFFGQIHNIDRKQIIDSEKNAAKKTISLLDYNTNPNTLNYDLQYVRLELDLDPTQQFVSGTMTSHFQMLENSDHIYFDLDKTLPVSQVKYHNQNLSFEQLSTDEIKINFPQTVSAQAKDSLSITYSGVPVSQGDFAGFEAGMTYEGNPILSTLSEPYGAKGWWPTKQSMNDKIEKMDIKITAPSQYNVASNGILKSETNLGNGKKLTYWQTNYPVAAYLVALGISNYTKLNSTITTSHSTFPFVNYLYPATANDPGVLASLDWTTDCMQNFEDHFGDYPFREEKYGHMQFNWGGGMEHQTMSSMVNLSPSLICHELAHQWFGDKLTCATWNDVWLNEGFATFGEHVTYEKLLMTDSQFQNYLAGEINYITSSAGGSVYVPDSGLSNINRVFDSRLTYSKGGFVLRMMKWILGDDQFYEMLKAYQNNPEFVYKYVTTEDFKNFVNDYTGKDFTDFFNDWVYGEGYPTYQIKWNQDAETKKIFFQIAQTTSSPTVSYFKMPLPIKVSGAGGQTTYLVLDNTFNHQNFSENIDFNVTNITFNDENQILAKGSVTKDSSLAVDDAHQTENINVYPNPAKSFIKISGLTKSTDYELFSVDGKLIKKGTTKPDSEINISNFVKGIYILKFNTQNIKIIKE